MHRTTRRIPAPAATPVAALAAALALATLAACGGNAPLQTGTGSTFANPAMDSASLVTDLSRLADDSLRGRAAGTPGNAQARRYVADRFDRLGLDTVGQGRLHPFTFTSRRDSTRMEGVNVVGLVRGTAQPDRYIVVTAHYDHVGVGRPVDGDSIYNGADDNASGTAALMALAGHFAAEPARHSILFVAFDAEEMGLQGARAFVASPPVPREAIALNVNMDMVSNSPGWELYAAGASRYPQLRAPLESVARGAPVTLLLGHDTPEPRPQDDWTMQSDHGPFHEAGIPFVYFGVEDHPHYHRPSDEVRNITPAFFVGAVQTIGAAIRELDGM